MTESANRGKKSLYLLYGFLTWSLIFPVFAHSAEIRGFVTAEQEADAEGIEVRLFDGFDISSTETDKRGAFTIQNDRVTAKESLVIYASKKGYFPAAENFDGGEAAYDKTFRLEKSSNPGKGFLIGTLYTPVSGGKLRSHFGIYRFIPEQRVILKNGKFSQEVRSDENGRFYFAVSPGKYRLKVEPLKKEYTVTIKAEETTLQNIPMGRILVD